VKFVLQASFTAVFMPSMGSFCSSIFWSIRWKNASESVSPSIAFLCLLLSFDRMYFLFIEPLCANIHLLYLNGCVFLYSVLPCVACLTWAIIILEYMFLAIFSAFLLEWSGMGSLYISVVPFSSYQPKPQPLGFASDSFLNGFLAWKKLKYVLTGLFAIKPKSLHISCFTSKICWNLVFVIRFIISIFCRYFFFKLLSFNRFIHTVNI